MNRIIHREWDWFQRRDRFREILFDLRKKYAEEIKSASFFGRLRLEWRIEREAKALLDQEFPRHGLYLSK
jgi:hypothetical protein